MTTPNRIWAWENKDPIGSSHGWNTVPHDSRTEYVRRDPAVLAELPEVRGLADPIMPEHVIRVAAMLIDSLHCLDTEAIQIATATNASGGVDGVQVLEDAEKIIKAAAGLVATELQGIAAAIREGRNG